MNGKDKISVIIPCYNVQKYIMRCFDSIYSQTYGFENLEVILIDDLSTDNTWSILESLQRQYYLWPDKAVRDRKPAALEKAAAELRDEIDFRIFLQYPSDDITMVEKAYDIAYNAHKEQKRRSGEPYIIHPLCVAIILADLELDKETIVAGILHDVVEDTVMTEEELTSIFGEEVALLVDGVTKLTQISWSMDKVEIQAENLRKMFLAMAKDIRVILIKLADRLHNMRTLQYMKPEKQKEKARETMDIYAPIADRLGISKIKTELDDLSLKYLEPEVYYELAEKVALRKDAREAFVQGIVFEVKSHMEDAGIEAKVDGRVKHFFSIYKKMVNQDKRLPQALHLFCFFNLKNLHTIKSIEISADSCKFTTACIYHTGKMLRHIRDSCFSVGMQKRSIKVQAHNAALFRQCTHHFIT